jgi:hypothetical protein
VQDQTEWDPRKKKGKHSKRGKMTFYFEFGTVLCALRTHIQKSNSTNMRAFVIEIRRLLRFKIGRTLSAAEDSEITIVTGRYITIATDLFKIHIQNMLKMLN